MEVSEHSRRLYGGTTNGADSGEKPHTLEEYALDHFRYPTILLFKTGLVLASTYIMFFLPF